MPFLCHFFQFLVQLIALPDRRPRPLFQPATLPQADESIVIDERITITILEVRGNKIRHGIEALKEITVKRKELIDTGMLTMIAV